MGEAADFIAGLFKDIKLPFRLLVIFLILILVVASLAYYERSTGRFYLGRLEKKVAILKELQNIANEGIEKNNELYPIYQSAVNELAQDRVHNEIHITTSQWFQWFPSVDSDLSVARGKAISGAFLWPILIILLIWSDVKNHSLSIKTIRGIYNLLIYGISFALIGPLIPTIFNPWVNYICFPIVGFLILLLIAAITYLIGTKIGTLQANDEDKVKSKKAKPK